MSLIDKIDEKLNENAREDMFFKLAKKNAGEIKKSLSDLEKAIAKKDAIAARSALRLIKSDAERSISYS